MSWKAQGRQAPPAPPSKKKPERHAASGKQRGSCSVVQVGSHRRPGAAAGPGGRRVRRRSTSRSTSPTRTRTSRPRRRTSTTPTARPSSASSPPRTASRSRSTRCRRTSGRGRRGREPVVLDRQGHRPQGHPARGVQQRPRQRDPGCVHDHPAVRQDPLPDPGALLQAQGQGGDPVAEDPAPAEQGARSSRATSTPSTSAAARTASRRRRRRTSTRTPRTSPCARRRAGQRAQQPHQLRPRQRQGQPGRRC